jgi:hypothetical protein
MVSSHPHGINSTRAVSSPSKENTASRLGRTPTPSQFVPVAEALDLTSPDAIRRFRAERVASPGIVRAVVPAVDKVTLLVPVRLVADDAVFYRRAVERIDADVRPG